MPVLLFFATALLLAAADYPVRVYVADLDAASATLAWGRADGTSKNTIGKGAEGSGKAEIRIDGRVLRTEKSWHRVEGLRADTEYPYTVTLDGQEVAKSTVRTWPARSDELTFFVIGDFGNGSKMQYSTAVAMEAERERLEKAGQHVRFVITTGDNLYGLLSDGGGRDRDWEDKFFKPYAPVLLHIPFKAVIGNHDGNESERAGDLEVCLDNFFLPDRWYRFEYASFAEFLMLDSTTNQPSGSPKPVYLAEGEQTQWLAKQLERDPLPWRMAAMHHPMFTAGPRHVPFLERGRHWFLAMRSSHVQAVFAGHEHNFQFSERNDATGDMQFVVSGAGGELRRGSVRKRMAARHIAAWGNESHFLAVTIRGKDMTIRPVGAGPIAIVDSQGKPATQPLHVPSK